MTARLRKMVIELQKTEILKEYLGKDFDTTSNDEKTKILNLVIDNIENDVDKMLNEHVEQHIKNSPEKKAHNKLMFFYTGFSISLTALLGYAFNEGSLALIIITYALLIGTQLLPYIIDQRK